MTVVSFRADDADVAAAEQWRAGSVSTVPDSCETRGGSTWLRWRVVKISRPIAAIRY
jgi:hypothetical protein